MKYGLMLLLFFLFADRIHAQSDAWTAFWNADSTLYGFKDKAGAVRMQPRFTGFGIARKLESIMVAAEENNGGLALYYITKNGRAFGRDSIYAFDNAPDCESEGFIRFHDHRLDKMGLFNRNGDVVVQSVYDHLSSVANGLIIALKSAVKKKEGVYFFWQGGTHLLMDTSGKVLIKKLDNIEYLNLYSIKQSKRKDIDPVRNSYRGENGKYYSFIDYKKEFTAWLNKLLNDLTAETLQHATFKEVTYWKQDEWASSEKADFIVNNFETVKEKLLQIKKPDSEFGILYEVLNPYIFSSDLYSEYYNNCGEAMMEKYPAMTLYMNDKTNHSVQYSFQFLRTDEGYKLISASL